MKKILAVLIPVACVIMLGSFLLMAREAPKQEARANSGEAQEVLSVLRRMQVAHQAKSSPPVFVDASAVKNNGKIVYSEGWNVMELPSVGANTGFNYQCFADEGICEAIEIIKGVPTGDGLQIDIKSGAYTCFGSYIPLTTTGPDGGEITTGCQT